MRVADNFSVSYRNVLPLLQVGILFLTQILTLIVLKKFRIRPGIAAAIILYLGISPAIINSVFSLYSEIAAYPFILLMVIWGARAWKNIWNDERTLSGITLDAAVMGIVSLLTVFAKAVFEAIVPVLLLPYVVVTVLAFRNRQKTLQRRCLIFLLISTFSFYLPLYIYKGLNREYNGHFSVTDRGASALYGNAMRRMEKLTPAQWGAAVAFVPGEDVCRTFFPPERCAFWSYQPSDAYSRAKEAEFIKNNTPPEEKDKIFLRLCVEKILRNPFQYFILSVLEGTKMLFWESTTIGFVVYPQWLTTLYDGWLLKTGLKFFVFLMTLAALIFSSGRAGFSIVSRITPPTEQESLRLMILLLIGSYIAAHSFFLILTRYSLPLGPLYLILVAVLLENQISRRRNRTEE